MGECTEHCGTRWLRYTPHAANGLFGRILTASWLLLTAGSVIPQKAHAQVRPDAGQTLESMRAPPSLPGSNPKAPLPAETERPALSTADTVRIPVKRWRITGTRVFAAAELQRLIQHRVGQTLTLRELNIEAARITAYYHQHGYSFSRAYLPEQDIRAGEVEIAVLEGRVANIHIDNASPVPSSVITQHVVRIEATRAVQGRVLERSLLLLNDLPGVEVRSILQPGATVGTADLDLHVRSTGRFDGSVDADSYGNRYTGEFRGGGTLNVNSPLQRGDLFTLRASTSGSGMTYGRAAWQTPLGGNGVRAGIAWSDLRYALGKEFDSLDAHGTARVGTAWAAYPLMRTQTRNLTMQLSYDDKRLEDRVDATSISSDKTLHAWTLGASADLTDALGGGGINTLQLDLISGRVSLDPLGRAIDQGIGGRETEGRYGKVAFNASRLQRVNDELVFYASLTGQLSSRNLDTSEMQSLGGAYGVRAYPQGEALGDDAAALNLELRWAAFPSVQLLAFADVGTVRLNHSAPVTVSDNRRTLTGEGLGAQWVRAQHFAMKAYVACRSGPQPTSDRDVRPRFWLQFAQYF
jgi:hemolysin activation/secretion protein